MLCSPDGGNPSKSLFARPRVGALAGFPRGACLAELDAHQPHARGSVSAPGGGHGGPAREALIRGRWLQGIPAPALGARCAMGRLGPIGVAFPSRGAGTSPQGLVVAASPGIAHQSRVQAASPAAKGTACSLWADGRSCVASMHHDGRGGRVVKWHGCANHDWHVACSMNRALPSGRSRGGAAGMFGTFSGFTLARGGVACSTPTATPA